MQRPDGTLLPFLPFPTPIRDMNGKLIGAVNMLVDITERKEAEASTRLLLDELNHRVKNNMQMLQGLLLAAQRESPTSEAAAILADAGQRVAAMAAAQQHLYRDSNARTFRMKDFVHAVCASAEQAFGKEIALHITAADGYLPNEISMPLAVILNELLTNAAKHAINGRGTGNIKVELTRRDGEIALCVEDDGPGFDLHETGRRASGLGLVKGLTRQLRGSFTVKRNRGARCTVRFPE